MKNKEPNKTSSGEGQYLSNSICEHMHKQKNCLKCRENKTSWEKEFENQFSIATFTWNGDIYMGLENAKSSKRKIKSFIRQELARERKEGKEEGIKMVGSWYQLPKYKDFNGACNICGGKSVIIRGQRPKAPQREICPTCTREVLESILDSCNNREQASKDKQYV